MQRDRRDFGPRLQAWRHRNRLTQSELAEALRYDVSYVVKIENGARPPTRQFMARLVQYSGEPEETLLSAPLGDAGRPPLPQPPDRLIGRDETQARLVTLLNGPARCVTLVGPPGIGKTRLAIEIANRLDKTLASGAWWIPLVDATSPDDVGRRLQQALGVSADATTDPVRASVARLGRQDALIVFDNFEHILEGRTVVSQLVSETPNVTVLVTSREPLGLLSEHVVSVPGLTLPDDAVALFVSRAQMVRSGFALTPANRPDVVKACARLDGIPLAIVLAAGAVRTIDPAGLAERLESGAALPGVAPADVASHHRTLNEAIASSWRALGDDARHMLVSAAVFSGGFTVEAAAAVDGCHADEAGRRLDELARKSLAEARPDASSGPRFELLETIRYFAAARLAEGGDAEALRARHTHYFTVVAEDLGARFTGVDQARCRHAFAAERENLRAAFEWSLARDAHVAIRLAASLWRPFLMSDIPAGRQWLDAALIAAPWPSPVRAVALAGSGALAWVSGQPEKADRHLREAADLAARLDLPDVVALALVNQGALAEQQDRFDEAEDRFGEALLIYEKIEDRRGRAVALNGLGMILRRRQRVNEAWPLWTEAAALFRSVGDGLNEALALGNKAWAAELDGRLQEAYNISQECRRIQLELGDARGTATTTAGLGRVAARRGALDEARVLYAEALVAFDRLADLPWVASTLIRMAGLAEQAAALDRAVTLIGAAETLLDQMGVHPREDEAELMEQVSTRCFGVLGEDRYRRAIGEGRTMSLADTVAFAGC